MIAVPLFALIVLGLLYFADDLDASRTTINCRCGRREIHCLADPWLTLKLTDELSAQCPWCTSHPATVRADSEPSED